MSHRDASLAVDVLVVGAGPAGTASILALQQAGFEKLAIVGLPREKTSNIGETAAPDVAQRLRRLGMPDRLDMLGHVPHHGTLSAWGHSAVHDFVSRGAGHGWHLNRASLDRWLLATAASRGATVLNGKVTGLTRTGDGRWTAHIESHARRIEINAWRVVLAAGRALPARLRLGVPLRRIDRQLALATTVQRVATDSGFTSYSIVEAVEHGWWYAARSTGGPGTVMLMTDPDVAQAFRLRDWNNYAAMWRSTTLIRQFVEPPSTVRSSISVHAAGTQFLGKACGDGWFAAGDALMALDPLTSSGIGCAIDDGIEVAKAIASLTGCRDSAAARDCLRAYASVANDTLRRFLKERREVYAREQRWCNTPFWQRRVQDGVRPHTM